MVISSCVTLSNKNKSMFITKSIINIVFIMSVDYIIKIKITLLFWAKLCPQISAYLIMLLFLWTKKIEGFTDLSKFTEVAVKK